MRIIAAMAVVMLGAASFACPSMTLAGLVLRRDRLMGIGQAITMPLFFASNALYPVDVMPALQHALSRIDPLSYEVNALRGLSSARPSTRWTSCAGGGGGARNRHGLNAVAPARRLGQARARFRSPIGPECNDSRPSPNR